ncbi:MAG: DUF6702 family protein [Erythrobacter cryptus]
MIARRAVLLALVLAPLASRARAHQQKLTITTLAPNPRSAMLEIVHQVPLHDAEHALAFQGVRSPDIIASPASREAFARYATRRFLLAVEGEIIVPDYVGSEVERGFLWVYQEWPLPGAGQGGGADAAPRTLRLRVNAQIFTDLWTRQENRVNIGRGTRVETLVFHGGDAPREALLRL